MFFEDARELTLSAVRLLESQKDALGRPDLKIWSPSEFSALAKSQALARSQKETIVAQAILLIDQFYAHLHFKRARYAVDPVQSLRILRTRLHHLSDVEFHDGMIQALIGLRDAHTFYGLPAPYRGTLAFLPFRMQSFHEKRRRRFIVTGVLEGFRHPAFDAQAEILSWNGVPIEQAIEREGRRDPGGNPASRFARGLVRMCCRPLTLTLPPEEQFVTIEYTAASGRGERRGIILPWYIGTDFIAASERPGAVASVNESVAAAAQGRRLLFRRAESIRTWQAQSQPSAPPPSPDPRFDTPYPHVFSFTCTSGPACASAPDPASLHDPAHPEKKFGYLRIHTFDLDPSDPNASGKFVQEFQRIVTLMQDAAPDGLILDVRGNPGGSIDAAERILQCLTPASIQPADFHFLNSRTTEQIARALNGARPTDVATPQQREWLPWVPDLTNSVADGGTITPGRPLTQPEQANDTGQIYQGPVTLIIDALAYSATDIFAAGFQDHKIGTVIGVDDNTGGGGANRWLHEELMRNLAVHGLRNMPLEKLPRQSQLGLAIRRSTRVGANAGAVLEDLGVKADVRHYRTRRDVLHNDVDLLAFACAHLGAAPAFRLRIVDAAMTPAGVAVSLRVQNLFRIECRIDGLPQYSAPAEGAGEISLAFVVPVAGLLDTPDTLVIDGFAKIQDPIQGAILQRVVTGSADLSQPADAAAHA
jgi:hypothetical protein